MLDIKNQNTFSTKWWQPNLKEKILTKKKALAGGVWNWIALLLDKSQWNGIELNLFATKMEFSRLKLIENRTSAWPVNELW